MTKKYIIKNCPCIYGVFYEYCKEDTYTDGSVKCIDRTNCLLKQIVEKCEEKCKRCKASPICTNEHCFNVEILSMLEIEECEE